MEQKVVTDLRRFAEGCSSALALFDAEARLAYGNLAFRDLFLAVGENPVGSGLHGLGLPPGLEAPLAEAFFAVRGAGTEESFLWEEAGAAEPRRFLCRLVPVAECGPGILLEVRELPAEERLKQALKAERLVRRQAEHLKERGRALFFKVIDELPVFVYMQRRDYSVAFANKKTKNFYGETDGRRCYEVFSGRDAPCPSCPTFRVFQTGLPEDWQFTDSKGRTFHIYDYPFEDESGEPLVMELGIDITELKRVERELFQAHKMRAIGVLAGGIAHDLNNNLVPIIFNVDYALGKTADETVSAPLGEALRAAYKAADLVEQVLEYSRQQNVSRSPLKIIQLIQENLELLQASLPKNVTLRAQYSARRDLVLANPAQVQQLLLNLCRNAVQAMPEGGQLSVSMRNGQVESLKDAPVPGLALGEYVALRVADTGCGIEPDKLERIFEPFYTSKRNSGGTGMGLAVVHAIATSNGGGIQVESEVGAGTVFTVYLPVCAPVSTQIVAEPAPARSRTGRLLLVDDDKGAQAAMARVLTDAGFEVTVAESGEEGLREFQERSGGYDLVLADQSMPGMNGLDLATRILEHDAAARIIICTGHVEPRLEQRAGAAGIAGFLRKPMTPRVLVENVRRHCR